MPAFAELIPPLFQGLWVTIGLAFFGIILASVLAIVAGLGRLSAVPPLKWIAVAYIEIFRGTSALVQLFWFFYVLPFFGVSISPFWAGVLVLGLNAGSYGAEVVQGTVRSVAKGQWEAARALNLTRRQATRRVIFPQALPTMVPPFNNIYIELLKNTALVSLITLTELTFTAQLIRSDTLRTTEVFLIVLVMYFAVAMVITGAMRWLERFLARRTAS